LNFAPQSYQRDRLSLRKPIHDQGKKKKEKSRWERSALAAGIT